MTHEHKWEPISYTADKPRVWLCQGCWRTTETPPPEPQAEKLPFEPAKEAK